MEFTENNILFKYDSHDFKQNICNRSVNTAPRPPPSPSYCSLRASLPSNINEIIEQQSWDEKFPANYVKTTHSCTTFFKEIIIVFI